MPFRYPLRRILIIVTLATVLNAVPGATSAQSGPLLLSGFPLLRQQHSLTCESAAASMGTRGQVTEAQIMAALPRDPNPNIGFRGNPNGQQGSSLVDYGVYAAPVSQALLRYGYRSDVLLYSSDKVLRLYLDKGWPVVTWVPYSLQPAKPRLVQHNGIQFFLVPHEHAILLVGYDRLTVLGNDPWNGKLVRYFWRDFNRGWGDFGNMALAIEPCAMTVPVDRVRVSSVTSTGVTWSWNKALNAATYDVIITHHGKKDLVLYHQVQSALSVTLSNPKPGATYQIAVRSMTSCGDVASPTALWLSIPRLPTVTPTPPVTPTPIATPSGTPPPIPSPETKATVTVTPAVAARPVTATPVLTTTPKP